MNIIIPLVVLAACVAASRWLEHKIDQHFDNGTDDGRTTD